MSSCTKRKNLLQDRKRQRQLVFSTSKQNQPERFLLYTRFKVGTSSSTTLTPLREVWPPLLDTRQTTLRIPMGLGFPWCLMIITREKTLSILPAPGSSDDSGGWWLPMWSYLRIVTLSTSSSSCDLMAYTSAIQVSMRSLTASDDNTCKYRSYSYEFVQQYPPYRWVISIRLLTLKLGNFHSNAPPFAEMIIMPCTLRPQCIMHI